MTTYATGKKRPQKTGRAPKYRNKRIQTVYGWFDSKGELQRYLYLLDAEKRGVIDNLKRQVPFSLDVNGDHICDYVADFTYTIIKNCQRIGDHIVEDYKCVFTDVFILKKKLMKAVHGIDVRTITTCTEDPCKVDNLV